ncbi:MAG TPA: methyltransferase domain-containing protein [Asticcacaulis sp.]|nr:methyltransferase domain-containing protein [Asticcacaulis sp.]
MTISSENRDGYDRWAVIYDSYVNSTVFVDDYAFPPVWAELSGRKVLEIGCGTGRHTIRLAQAGNSVTGLDLSPGMLAEARRKLAGYPNVTLIEGDLLTAQLTGFEAVVTALVLEHIADLNAFFSQASAALVASGKLFLSEIHPDRIAGGTQANFTDAETGQNIRLKSFAHSEADIQTAATHAGLRLISHEDIVGDRRLPEHNPGWQRHIGRKMIRIWTFAKA